MSVDLTKRTPREHVKASRDVLNKVAGPLVLLMTLALVVMYWNANHQAREAAARDREAAEYSRLVSDCQARHNRAVVDAISGRAELNNLQNRQVERSLRAVQRLIVGAGQVTRAPQDTYAQRRAADARFRQLFADYDQAIADQARITTEIARKRAAIPLPDFPDCSARALRSLEAG